jgi:hypothetical protein
MVHLDQLPRDVVDQAGPADVAASLGDRGVGARTGDATEPPDEPDDLRLADARLPQQLPRAERPVRHALRPVQRDHPLRELLRMHPVRCTTSGIDMLQARIEEGEEQRVLVGGREAGLIEEGDHPLGELDRVRHRRHVVLHRRATVRAAGPCTDASRASARSRMAATQVEAHRVLGRSRGDDDLGVTSLAGDELQLIGQTAASARGAEPVC